MNTTSLKQSQRLKELGVKQGAELYWTPIVHEMSGGVITYSKEGVKPDEWKLLPFDVECKNTQIPAYSCSEMLEMMPQDTELHKWVHPNRAKGNPKYGATHCYNGHPFTVNAETPAQALGMLLINLLESGIVKSDDLS